MPFLVQVESYDCLLNKKAGSVFKLSDYALLGKRELKPAGLP